MGEVISLADHPSFKPERQLVTRAHLMASWSINSVNTIKRYVKLGMPEERLPGGSPRYDIEACDDWLRQRRNSSATV